MEDPVILNYIRIGYVVSQLIALAAYYWTSIQVRLTPLLSNHAASLTFDISALCRLKRRTT